LANYIVRLQVVLTCLPHYCRADKVRGLGKPLCALSKLVEPRQEEYQHQDFIIDEFTVDSIYEQEMCMWTFCWGPLLYSRNSR